MRSNESADLSSHSFNAQVDSEAAEEILKDANISDDVIAGVRALSKGQSMIDQVTAELRYSCLLGVFRRNSFYTAQYRER